MTSFRFALAIVGCAALFAGSPTASAETKVTLKEMHLCCGACVKAVNGAVKEIKDAAIEVDRDNGSVTITAQSDEAAQKAVDAIAAAGFHGASSSDKIAMKDDSGAEKGKVGRLELTGVHNCCGGCNVAVKKALAAVDGVKSNNAKPKSDTIVVEGDFDALALVKSLNQFGFHVKVKK